MCVLGAVFCDPNALFIAKNRNGIEKKTIDINFEKDTQRIYEI